jgi:apolipoprotein N-acyltransferase
MSGFYPMKRGDFWYLIAIITFAFISFLPWSRRIIISGMALFGWMMAALMIISPAAVLVRLIIERQKETKENKILQSSNC